MARRIGVSGTTPMWLAACAVSGAEDSRWRSTSCLVSRPAPDVTWRGSSPCSASSRAARGVGFGAGDAPGGVGEAPGGPGDVGVAMPLGTPMRAIGVSTATVSRVVHGLACDSTEQET